VSWLAELLWGSAPGETISKIVEATNKNDPEPRLSTATALILTQPESQLN
jgi:hypothetical protein